MLTGPYWRAEEQICVITGTQLSTENQGWYDIAL